MLDQDPDEMNVSDQQPWLYGAAGENKKPDNMGPNGVARLEVRSQYI
jgi:hypothetical protein